MATAQKTKKSSPFDNLKIDRESMHNSIKWFQDSIKILNRSSYQPKALMNNGQVVKYFGIGEMLLFNYDPKTKETLDYYDTNPLIFVVHKTSPKNPDMFSGINLHYLDPRIRLKLLQKLYEVANNDRFDATTRLRITYDILVRLSDAGNLGVRNCYKNYLRSHVVSKGFLLVPPSAWPMTTTLPIERFVKHSAQYVWQKSKRSL